MTDLEIHPVRSDEAPALVTAGCQAGYIEDRLALHAAGHGVLLAAWLDGSPAGSVYLWLAPAEEPEIREFRPGTPLITHLEVFENARNRGIGTRLMAVAESELRARGFRQVALAVELSNTRALDLYERLGYRDWGCDFVVCARRDWNEDGTFVDTPEKCYVLTKSLAKAPCD
ncbi:GNAT family N-acetyltransferase [Kutzneria sp. NPDC052558]|uniref:GNAT family N-acetyltransferase n=1 Tax=Kutzneria sp. NPDC052558 TaxID=3364121 RepID=UPI0037C96C7E